MGKKLAQRIVAELKDKAPALSVAGLQRAGQPAARADRLRARIVLSPRRSRRSPTSATSRGRRSQAVAAAMAELGEEADTPKLIRRGLKELAR